MYEAQQDALNRGCQLKWLSQFPEEAEVVFGPLTGIELLHDGTMDGSTRRFVIRPTCNQLVAAELHVPHEDILYNTYICPTYRNQRENRTGLFKVCVPASSIVFTIGTSRDFRTEHSTAGNQRSVRIEDLVARRKRIHIDMLKPMMVTLCLCSRMPDNSCILA